MKRAEFIRSSCSACALFAMPGIATLLLESCAGIPSYKAERNQATRECTVPLVKFGQSKILLLRIKNSEFDFAVVKQSESEYKTFELKCTHEDQPLNLSDKNIFCTSHGSIFNFEGVPIKEPASRPLKQLKTRVADGQLIIQLS